MSREYSPPTRMPGAWVDSPPSFVPRALPDPPARSALQPSEPTKPTLNPHHSEQIEFYYDLIKGFSDMVLHTYRMEYVPKLRAEEGRPGMFLLKKGPSKEFLNTKFEDAAEKRDLLSEEASKADLYKFDKHDLERPTAVLNVDFFVSACSDYVPPPPPPERKIAQPVSLLGRPQRGYASSLKTLKIGRPKEPSPPPREPSPELDLDHPRPSQEEIHAGHQCFDVERLAREFMWWFLEWRAAIPRHLDYTIEKALEATVYNYTRKGDYGWVERQNEPEYKQCLNNLIWELKHPRASRPGQTNPNGARLYNRWLPGDELIHTILGLSNAREATIELRIKTMLRYAHTMRNEKNPWTPFTFPTLWDVLSRPAAPFDHGRSRDDHVLKFSNGKRLQDTDMERYHDQRKRRLMWDGTPEFHEPDVPEENAEEEDGGLTMEDREKLIDQLNRLQGENQKLHKDFQRADHAASKAKNEIKELKADLKAEQRTKHWVAEQGQSSPEPEDSDSPDMMDLDG